MQAVKKLASNSVLTLALSVTGIVTTMLILSHVWAIAGPIIDGAIISLAAVVGYGFVVLASVAIFCASVVMLSTTARFTAMQWFGYLVGRSKARKKLLQSEFEFRTLAQGEQGFMFSRPDANFVGRPISLEPGPFTPASLPDDRPVSLAKWQYLNTPPAKIENAVPLLEAGAPAPRGLPARVDLAQLMTAPPSLNNLILGVTYDDHVVTDSLKSLTHIAIAGTSRWGKSIFTQQLVYQIAAARENTTLYLADLGGTTFLDFGLPYASSMPEVEAMIADVMSEAERRKTLYEGTGRGIRSLDIYNQVTGDNLPWVVMVIDEALYLMEKSRTVKESLEIAVSWAAKYGITAVIVSQDWKSNVIATSTRNNFSSRFQFLAEDRTQANILVKGCEAEKIENKGRCFARLPGGNRIVELQTPYISEAEIAAIAPHIQDKAGAIPTPTYGAVTSPVTDAPPLTFVVAPDPDPPLAKHDPVNVNAAIDALLAADPETFPTKGQVSEFVGVTGGSKYRDIIKIYEQRLAEWEST